MKQRILVVDDSPTIRKVVTGILERHGYDALAAADAQLALEALASSGAKFDLILVDFVMPRMNGFQFCRELRKTDGGQSLPVVLMSAKSDKIREKFVLQTGAVDAITKPFDAQALVTLIEHALERISRGHLPAIAEGGEHPSSPPPSVQDPISASTASLSGDLATVPIGAVMQLLQMEAISGALVVSSGDREVRIFMRKGLVDRVDSRGAGDEFRLGRFFVEEGLVTPAEIEAALAPSSEPPGVEGDNRRRRLGERLVRSEKITDAQLRDALARQSSELIYEALRWQRGRFELRAVQLDDNEARLALPVASVVMEGFRRVDEWRLIEAKLGNFDEVLVPDPVSLSALGEDKMTKPERAVLAAIDSERTLREVVRASHMSSFDACKIVCQFLEARLVRRRAAA